MSFLRQYKCESTDFSVMIDDDDRVAYAYLLEGEKIVSHVWLYNRGEAPDEPEWPGLENEPYTNSKEYTRGVNFSPIEDEGEIEIRWSVESGSMKMAEIIIRGELFARLTPGSAVGWSVLAAKDGHLAKVLKSEELSE